MEDTTQRIADKLAEIFPDATIYTENQKSGFDVPSFYIAKSLVTVNNRFFNIQDRQVSYQVVYFANPETPNDDMEQVEGALLDNFVRLGNYATVRNREIKTDQDEQTLTMMFDLFLNMYRVDNTPKQRRLDINERGLKEESNQDSGK